MPLTPVPSDAPGPDQSGLSRPVTRCLGCGSDDLRVVLDLGTQPLANSLREPGSLLPEPRFPLGIQVCGRCHLVQLTETVDPALLFSSYLYVPSTSSTWLRHCEELAEDVCEQAALKPGELVVEIGSNDGTLLRAFQRRGQRVLGVDPAQNIAARATESGVPTRVGFFNQALAAALRAEHGPVRAIVSTNVLAHVSDPVDVLRGVRTLLHPDGLYVNESPSLQAMVEGNEFDTIYHEHMSYFSLVALGTLAERAGLRIVGAAPQDVHGGTLRIRAARAESERQQEAAVQQLAAAERAAGVLDRQGLDGFARRVATVRDELRALVRDARAAGARVAAYGATAKGNTLLGYCGLDHADIAYIVDRNPLKQGLLTPGSHIPVVPPERLRTDRPDVLLLLAWNLAEEIQEQLAWFGASGGRYIVPVPWPRWRGPVEQAAGGSPPSAPGAPPPPAAPASPSISSSGAAGSRRRAPRGDAPHGAHATLQARDGQALKQRPPGLAPPSSRPVPRVTVLPAVATRACPGERDHDLRRTVAPVARRSLAIPALLVAFAHGCAMRMMREWWTVDADVRALDVLMAAQVLA